jgi:arginase family enzyme
MSGESTQQERTYHVVGVPLRTGSLVPGSENDALPFRYARLVERLREAGHNAIDAGDVEIPSYLPHHTVPPIRNWPGPRIAWDCVANRVAPLLQRPGHVPLLVGCDCSVVVGTVHALAAAAPPREVYVLYVDRDWDDAEPDANSFRSAAAMAIWLVTHASPFWSGPPLHPEHVTVIGWSAPSAGTLGARRSYPLADVRSMGPTQTARLVLDAIPPSALILLHLDVDVFDRQHMPASYFPHDGGLTLGEGRELLAGLARDPRVRLIEVSEYASLRDPDQHWAAELTSLLASGLSGS